MSRVYNTDNASDIAELRAMSFDGFGGQQIIPRLSTYGEQDALDLGLQPLESVPDVLVPKDSYKEVIEHCHKEKVFPLYWMYDSWCPAGTKWNQDGLGYCWTWSGTACVMTVRAAERKPLVQLSPVSMGFLVGWANRGNYLESYIKGARETGITPASFVPNQHSPNPSSFKDGWEDARKLYLLDAVYDTSNRSKEVMTQHCISILATGRPLFSALYWWGHAVPYMSVRWDDKLGLVWKIRNSHNEEDCIELSGSRGVPDEAFGFVSTKVTE